MTASSWITISSVLYALLLDVDACLGGGNSAGGQQCCPARAAPTCGSAIPPCGGQQFAPPPLPQSAYQPPQQMSSYYPLAPPQPPIQQSPYSYGGNINSPPLSYASDGQSAPPAPQLILQPPPSPFSPTDYQESPLNSKLLLPPPQASRNQQTTNSRSTTTSSPTTTAERTSYYSTSTTQSSKSRKTTTESEVESEPAGNSDENKQTDSYNFALQDDVDFEQQEVESARKTLESNSAEFPSP